MVKYKVLIILFLTVNSLVGQSAHQLLREGDQAYNKGDYVTAEEGYRKSSQENASYKSDYNLANTLYNQNRYVEAIQYYQSALPNIKDDNIKSQAYHNLGNALYKAYQYDDKINQELAQLNNGGELSDGDQKKLEQLERSKLSDEDKGKVLQNAVNSFKEALRLDPKDMETKYNLQKTKQVIKQQQQQQQEQQEQQQDDNNKEDQDEKDQDEDQDKKDEDEQNKDKQDEEKEDDEKEDDENQEESDEDQDISDQEESSKTREEDKNELDKEDALKLLQVIENEEKKVQEKMRRVKDGGKKPEKDW